MINFFSKNIILLILLVISLFVNVMFINEIFYKKQMNENSVIYSQKTFQFDEMQILHYSNITHISYYNQDTIVQYHIITPDSYTITYSQNNCNLEFRPKNDEWVTLTYPNDSKFIESVDFMASDVINSLYKNCLE